MKASTFLKEANWKDLMRGETNTSLGLHGERLEQLRLALLRVVTVTGNDISVCKMISLHAQNMLEVHPAFLTIDQCDSVGELAQVHAMVMARHLKTDHLEESDQLQQLLGLFVEIRDNNFAEGHPQEGVYHGVAVDTTSHLRKLLVENLSGEDHSGEDHIETPPGRRPAHELIYLLMKMRPGYGRLGRQVASFQLHMSMLDFTECVIIPPKETQAIFQSVMDMFSHYFDYGAITPDSVLHLTDVIRAQLWKRYVIELGEDELRKIFCCLKGSKGRGLYTINEEMLKFFLDRLEIQMGDLTDHPEL